MGTIPQEIIQKIKDYTPRDKDMKSPTADHIKSLLRDYILKKAEDIYTYGFYIPFRNEPFYKYTLRIYKIENGYQDKELYPERIPDNDYTGYCGTM